MSNKRHVQVTEPKLRFKNDRTTIEVWVLDVGQYAKLADHKNFHFYATESASLIYVTKGPGGFQATEEHIDDQATWDWIQQHMSKGIAQAQKRTEESETKQYAPSMPDPDSIAMNPSGDRRDQA